MEDVAYLLNLLNIDNPPKTYNPEDYDDRIIALSQKLFIEGNIKEMDKIIEEYEYPYGDVYEYEDRQYFVSTDYDANLVFEEILADDLDYLVYDKISTEFHQYIDAQSFVSDKMREFNRGEFLARHDGLEHRAEVDGEDYFIYRLR